MAETTAFKLTDETLFKRKALQWANQFNTICLLDSNRYTLDKYASIQWILAVDALEFIAPKENSFDKLKTFLKTSQDKVFGFFTYDLKNEIEQLTSSNIDKLNFSPIYFFKPRYIIEIKNGKVIFNRNYPEAFDLFERIMAINLAELDAEEKIKLQARTDKDKYLRNIECIKEQIVAGDFYEMNYCCEFYAEHSRINPINVFNKLNEKAKAPFSCFFKLNDKYLLCASPERFIKKQDSLVVSQPIKGTVRRGATEAENNILKQQLLESEKERAENIMIVDLVRNDLAKNAITGTVNVDELFGIYQFATVQQMISTVSALVKNDTNPVDIIKGAFPMGSMTGAPKVEVMKNIEVYEDQKRGLYSGSVGYFTTEGNFDFNVVIRSIFYNEASKYVSIQVGGAITYDANPDAEYEEMLLKANAMLTALNAIIV